MINKIGMNRLRVLSRRRDVSGESSMDHEQLLQEASRLSRIISDDMTLISRQRELVESLSVSSNAEELEQAEEALKAMLAGQAAHEKQLARIQAQLIF
jgi:hypothetical protein